MTTETKITDGGPAFPVPYEFMGAGMSLRDAMAIGISAPEDMSISFARELAGRHEPEKDSTVMEHIRFWMDAEAAYRYLMADAMLKAREAV